MITGYHVNAFYLQIWGMLDHLAKIISAIYELDISEIGSGFSSKKFKTKLKTKQPELHSTIYTSKTEAWINTLAQIRHQAAHNYIHLPTDIVRDTPDSKKTDHEISEILKTSGELDDLDEETKKILLPILINNWRIDKRERIGSGMISVKGKKKPFLYPVINSIDYELEQLNNILKIIFNFVFDLQPPSETPPQH